MRRFVAAAGFLCVIAGLAHAGQLNNPVTGGAYDPASVAITGGSISGLINFTSPVTDKGGQVFNVTAYGLKGDGTTDNTSALNTLLSTVYSAGGGILYWPPGTYLIAGQIILPNNGISVPAQPSERWTGAGPSHNGEGASPSGGAIIDLTYAGSGYDIETLGLGYLEIDHLTLENTNSASSTPFIFTTNTTLHIHDNEFYGAQTTTSNDQDAIVLGGTGTTINGTASSPFQGYGTVIRDCYMNHMRRFVLGQVFANGVQIVDNTIWSSAGSDLADGAAIEFNGAGGAGGSDSGGYIAGNLIEMSGYPYGIKLANAIGFSLVHNNFYDPTATTLAYYRMESTAQFNYIAEGYGSTSYVFLSDATSNQNTVVRSAQSAASIWSGPQTYYDTGTYLNSGYGPRVQDTSGNYFQPQITSGNIFQWWYLPSGGSASGVMDLYVPGTTDKRLQVLGTTNSRIEAPYSQLQVYSEAGQALWLGDPTNNVYFLNGVLHTPFSITMSGGAASTITPGHLPVASLPTCNSSSAGQLLEVSDQNGVPSHGVAPAGGGTLTWPVVCDSVAWLTL